ncbi:hypothetical protein JCM11641_006114 [Rhodosporidiobolus odoratus]
MSFDKLPREVKEMIVECALAQDKVIRRRRKEFDLSLVSPKLRFLALPFRFDVPAQPGPCRLSKLEICTQDDFARQILSDFTNPGGQDFQIILQHGDVVRRKDLSTENSALREAIQKCTSLRSLRIFSTAARDHAAIHASWLTDHPILPSLPSLSLTLNSADAGVFSFLLVFPNLQHLSLHMPHVDDTAGPPQDAYALPLLETLKLNQPDLDDVVQTLEFFDLSQLKLLRLCIADFDNEEGSGPEELPCMTFLLDWLQQHEQVETLRLSASESKGVWPTEMLQWLKHELLWYTPPVAFRVVLSGAELPPKVEESSLHPRILELLPVDPTPPRS